MGSLSTNGMQPEPQEANYPAGSIALPLPSQSTPQSALEYQPAASSQPPPFENAPIADLGGIRTLGVGTAFGGGMVISAENPASQMSFLSFAYLLPSLEMQFFTHRGHSIDISAPIVNTLLQLSLSHGQVLVGSIDLFYNFNVGSGRVRFLVGPGVGLAEGYSFRDGFIRNGYLALRFPAEFGVEFLTRRRGFGFKLLARPWAHIGTASDGSMPGPAFGGGVIGALGLSFYKTGPMPD